MGIKLYSSILISIVIRLALRGNSEDGTMASSMASRREDRIGETERVRGELDTSRRVNQ